MFELGRDAAAFHREVGQYARDKGVRVLAVGALSRSYLGEADDGIWYATVEECIAALPGAIAPGSAVLVKASRGLRLERVVEAILAPPPASGAVASGAPATAEPDGPEGRR